MAKIRAHVRPRLSLTTPAFQRGYANHASVAKDDKNARAVRVRAVVKLFPLNHAVVKLIRMCAKRRTRGRRIYVQSNYVFFGLFE